jgi:RNA polymerase sigma-70 factor (ECF subfamily)
MDEPAGFESILRETQSAVRAYIAGLGVPIDDVDDVAQEVYLEFHKGGSRPPAGVEPARWLKGIARNLCMDRFRRARRREDRRLEALAAILDRAETPWSRANGSGGVPDALDGCLEGLPAHSRDAVMLRYAHSLSSSDIGRRLGMSGEAVRVLLFRVRAALRDCMRNRLATEGRP